MPAVHLWNQGLVWTKWIKLSNWRSFWSPLRTSSSCSCFRCQNFHIVRELLVIVSIPGQHYSFLFWWSARATKCFKGLIFTKAAVASVLCSAHLLPLLQSVVLRCVFFISPSTSLDVECLCKTLPGTQDLWMTWWGHLSGHSVGHWLTSAFMLQPKRSRTTWTQVRTWSAQSACH